ETCPAQLGSADEHGLLVWAQPKLYRGCLQGGWRLSLGFPHISFLFYALTSCTSASSSSTFLHPLPFRLLILRVRQPPAAHPGLAVLERNDEVHHLRAVVSLQIGPARNRIACRVRVVDREDIEVVLPHVADRREHAPWVAEIFPRAVGCSEQASIRPASRPQHSFGSSATACAIISCPIRRGNCKRNGVDKTAFTSEVNTFPF